MTSKFNLDDSTSSVGLNLSSDPYAFKDGDYSFLLNGCLHGAQNDNPFIRMFPGNLIAAALPSGFFPLCNLPISHKDVCVFSVSPSTGISEIGLFDGYKYVTKVQSAALGFRIDRQIQAEADEDFNGRRIVVWVQQDAPIRFIDLNNIPMIGGVLDIEALAVFKQYSYPQATIVGVTNNGRLPAAAYYVIEQYADENGNGLTAWSTPVGPVFIYRDSVSQPMNLVNGSPDKEPTNKAISIRTTGLDRSFNFYNIGIIKSFAGIREPFVVQTLPTQQDTYLYTGAQEGEVPIDIKEVITPSVSYTSAKTISRSNGSMLIGNLKGRQEYNLQPEMAKIQVLWQVNKEKYTTIDATGANPLSGTYHMEYRRNEIYALGIVIRWHDGSKSRVYPLVPREKDKHANGTPITKTTNAYGEAIPAGSWDSYKLPASDDIYETGAVQERHKIFNTGFKSGSDLVLPTDSGPADYGEFGYWESTERYPLDARVWGTNAGKPVRHFMMPDFVECPLTDGQNDLKTDKSDSYIFRLGLRFSNIDDIMNALPAEIRSQMSGWELVRGDRRNNRSVIASGLMYNMWYQNWKLNEWKAELDKTGNIPDLAKFLDVRLYANYPLNDLNDDTNFTTMPDPGGRDMHEQDHYRKDIFTFVSPDTEFDKTKLLAGSLYLHQESYGTAKVTIDYMTDYPRFKQYQSDDDYAKIFYHVAAVGYYNNWKATLPGNLRRELLETMYIPFNSLVSGGSTQIPVHNLTRDATVLLYTGKTVADPSVEDTSRAYARDPDFVCNMSATGHNRYASSYYASIISRLPNQYGSVFDTRWLPTNFDSSNIVNNKVIFGGDTFINRYGMVRELTYFQNAQDYMDFPDGSRGVDLKSSYTIAGIMYYYTSVPKRVGFESSSECEEDPDKVNKIPMIYTGIPYFFTESDHNVDLQLNGAGPEETFYPNLKDGSLTIQKWNGVKTLDKPFEHLINRSYQEVNDLYSYENADPFYDPDKKDVMHYATRTIFSLTATPENRVSNILIFKPLNYFDFRKDAGELWDIRDLGNNRMLFRLEHALFMDQKYATIPILGNQIVLGTGKLFETEPVLLRKADSGFLGTNSQWAFNNTPFGAFFIDSLRGVAVQFTDKADDISEDGVDNYLTADLPLKLRRDIPYFKNFDNPANPNGIGYISVYDSFNKLWIITKRDYEVIDKSMLGRFAYNGDVLEYNGAPALLSDRGIFADRSFTFCYSVISRRWVGWQSFLPTMYCVLGKEYYSFAGGAYWQHNKGLPRTYYGKRYPFVFEGVIRNAKGESLAHSCTWITRCFEIRNNIQQGESFTETFNKGIFYNVHQSTGMVALTVQDENDLSTLFRAEIITPDLQEKFLRRRERMWQVDELFDMVVNHEVPFFTNDATAVQPAYFIDKVLDNSNINYGRDYRELAILNDLWMKYRLFYDKDQDVQMYLYIALGMTEQVVT